MNNPFETIEIRLSNIECLLLDLKHSGKSVVPANPEDEQPITISEAAALTNLAVATLYGLTHRRKIPSYRQGKRLYFLKSELLAWIKSGRRATIQEMIDDDGESI